VWFEMTTSNGDLITEQRVSKGKMKKHTYLEHKLKKYEKIFRDETSVLPIGQKALVIVFNGNDSTKVLSYLNALMARMHFNPNLVGLVYLSANFAIKFSMRKEQAEREKEQADLRAEKEQLAKEKEQLAKENQRLAAELAAVRATR